eukprot:CAMPEP_0174251006 /NCGR_PEP_ID=MMETSP0439-20130205/984_1 /TAXON_ID=0 /ORGANISM="Stereomyxa ramosa, Strain Chinc5" /LENGTH=137 /DNA_ID=CAMNT_0015331219 /DNA_START=26 /DNA_END=439 /DNA_ORIENTATION=-
MKSLFFLFALVCLSCGLQKVYVGGPNPTDFLKFSPQNITVKSGDTVEFYWTSVPHSVTQGTNCTATVGGFDSGVQSLKQTTFNCTFMTAGTLDYFCVLHCSKGMEGKVMVTDSDGVLVNRALVPDDDFSCTGPELLK